MPLISGARLGPYEIVGALGAGGMGEVYKARDTRLDRLVAVKVLPEMLAADPQFRARFELEARAISQLAHPNICMLHDVGEDHGTSFLVMEYLEGETLADRIARGPLPLADALPTEPQWSRSGRELFFMEGPETMMRTAIKAGAELGLRASGRALQDALHPSGPAALV
jgi:Protein kinase domain